MTKCLQFALLGLSVRDIILSRYRLAPTALLCQPDF